MAESFAAASMKFAEGSTQWQLLNAIELLSSPGRFVREDKIIGILKLMSKANGTKEASLEDTVAVLKFLTDTGVLEMSRREFPTTNQLCGCGSCCGDCCGGCCGCGRYYRIKIGAM
ncbi:hypothetical protein M8J76_000247 [Diaphorina citri]|nr:hypothetical protein M8J75_010892 [Diaphorina citri]KAI5729214.1 hypothetical protein M8J76_000247 [Diaphorina citri]KAI5734597.1 hypothetical protein M8J77_008559 [Diaphorina citri]